MPDFTNQAGFHNNGMKEYGGVHSSHSATRINTSRGLV